MININSATGVTNDHHQLYACKQNMININIANGITTNHHPLLNICDMTSFIKQIPWVFFYILICHVKTNNIQNQ